MKIYCEKQLLENNDYVKNINDIEIMEPGKEYSDSIILKQRKNSYIIPYEYGTGIKGKDEYVIRWGIGCIYDCIYCYSKLKVKDSNITMFPDINAIHEEIRKLSEIKKDILLNAGENFDSFILEKKIPFSEKLSIILSEFENVKCEFRTKAIVPDSFIEKADKRNILIAFSISPAEWRKKIELKTPPLEKIFENISKLQDKGFEVAIRFEPVILFDGWKEKYSETIKELDRKTDIRKIQSIDIALLRLTKQGYRKVSAFPEIIKGELLYHKEDSKYRYFLPFRIKAYRFLINELRKYYSGKTHIGTEPEKFIERWGQN